LSSHEDEKMRIGSTRPTPARAARAFMIAVTLSTAPAFGLPGDLATSYQVNDDDPIKSIPTPEQRDANPLEFGYFLQDLIARAEGAFEKKDWARSVKYYEALARTSPDAAISFSRLCVGYAELGRIEIAAGNCGRAIERGGARVIDHLRFAGLTLAKPVFGTKDAEDVEASLAHVRAHIAQAAQTASAKVPSPAPAPSASGARSKEDIKRDFLARQEARLAALGKKEADPPRTADLATEVEVFACKVGIRLRDAARLDRCLVALREQKAKEALLLPFEWANALLRKDQARAVALLARAKSLGLPASTLEAMQAEQKNALAPAGILGVFTRSPIVPVLLFLGLSSVAAVGWFGLRRWKRRESPAVQA
jgi:hypothetical protein